MSDSPTAPGAYTVILNQRAATAPYHREVVEIQGDEHPGKAIGFDGSGLLTALAVGGGATLPDGVVGDGVADDTLAIQTAIDTGFCYLPARTYKITTLEMPSNAILRGAGHGTVLRSTVTGATAIIRNKVGAVAVTTGVEISSLTISGTDGSGGTGLWLNTFTNSAFTNLRLLNCRNAANTGRGLYMENAFGDCYNNSFAALIVENCDDAITLTSINAANSCGYNFFSAVTIVQEINGIKLLLGSGHGGTYNTFTGIFFQGNAGPGIYLDISGYGNRLAGINVDAPGAGPILKLQSTANGNFVGITSGWDPAKYQNLSSLPNTVDCTEALCYAPDNGFVVADPCADLKVYFRSPASPTGEVEINLGNATADLWKMVMQGSATPYLVFRYGVGNTPILYLFSNTVRTTQEFEVDTVGKGFVLKSPDGTRWRIQVANTTGALSTTPA